jgi:tripartite-type tricarboxylate transporter receptor subunit TctC
MLQNRVGIELMFIPYPSVARATQDAISGILPVYIESLSAVAGPIQSGSLKALAVASPTRLPNFPDLPTVAEEVSGLEGFEARGWFALTAPARASEAIIRKVSQDLRAVLQQSEVQMKFQALGTYARPMSPAATAEFIRREQELWRPLVRQVGVIPQ